MQMLYNWWSGADPHKQLAQFAGNLHEAIPRFSQTLTTAFKEEDTTLYNQLLTVNYLYQSTLNDLTVRYYFTNQPPGNPAPYGYVFLSKAIGSPFNYEKIDEETHIKIFRFMNNHMTFFKGPFAGFTFQDSDGYKNLSYVSIVAHDQFQWDNTMTIAILIEKIKLFQDTVQLAWKEFHSIYRKPAAPPVYRQLRLPKPLQTQSLSVETDQVYQKLEAFNKLFNLIVNDPTNYSFTLTDNSVRFSITYIAQSKQFQFSAPVNNRAPFQVTKQLQEKQRTFCSEHAKMIKEGTLQLKQDPLTLNTIYEASRPFPIESKNEFNSAVIAFVNHELEVAAKVF